MNKRLSQLPFCAVPGFKGIAASLLLFFGFVSNGTAQTAYALSGNNLISFKVNAPGNLLNHVTVSGIAPGQSIEGLDFRPNTGQLYALGYAQGTGAARLYTIDLTNGAATAIGSAPVTLKTNMGKISVDFNPTVDRIRVTGSDNSNYRLHPVTGALVATDGNLGFAAADVNANANPSIGAVAYTNSYIGATSTTLYNYDDSLNIFTTQNPPNNGTLNTLGASGITVNLADPSSDFDIFFDAVSGTNKAYFVANTGSQTADNLFTVNLTTGAVAMVGQIGNGMSVSDIAVFVDRTVPGGMVGQLTYGLTSNNNLVSFDAGMPGVVRKLVPVTGVATGQVLSGLDFRPATGELYSLGYSAGTGEARLYTIDPATGVATPIGASAITLNANMGKISMDFNPTVDRIRVTGSDNSNYRLHPVTGALAATDGNQAFAAGDLNAGLNPSIGTGAYTNSFGGATATILYNYDDSLNILSTQIPPNNGTLNTIGASGITVNPADPSSDLDIFYSAYGAPNTAFFAANVGTSSFDNLYTINLSTGLATLIGKIGNGIAIVDIAVSLQPIETACDIKTVECVKYEILNISKNSSGDKIYRVRVTNNCADKLTYVVFQLPNGVTAVGASAGTYNSPAGHLYELRNPNFSPFYSIRFKDQSTDGIANGQSDLFEYALPASANPNYIHVGTRTGASFREAYLNVFNCLVTNTASKPGSEERNADNEWNAMEKFQVFPNPSTGILFADLSAWEDQKIQLRVFNAQGQTLLFQSIQGGDVQQMIQIPDHAPEGLYFLELTTPDGQKQVRKIVVNRG